MLSEMPRGATAVNETGNGTNTSLKLVRTERTMIRSLPFSFKQDLVTNAIVLHYYF